jgi:putative membrane protein
VVEVVRFLIRTAITAVGVLVVAYLGLITIQGVGPNHPFTLPTFWTAFVFAIVLGLVNAVIKPVVSLLSLPVTIITLGLFSLVINLAMFYLAAAFTPIRVDAGWLATALAAIIVAVFSGFAGSVTRRESRSRAR